MIATRREQAGSLPVGILSAGQRDHVHVCLHSLLCPVQFAVVEAVVLARRGGKMRDGKD